MESVPEVPALEVPVLVEPVLMEPVLEEPVLMEPALQASDKAAAQTVAESVHRTDPAVQGTPVLPLPALQLLFQLAAPDLNRQVQAFPPPQKNPAGYSAYSR